ncbi:hypothetical protein F2Q68_00040851 [Brassica cretica]|uniref:Uncharacterized protein n=1 Tax=Brassica cretica TaxID=69181 RepID=A0A8S9MEA4_BRACR|nr:hypothetical protein F2Q68_00040851 [Brassica cretica]
MIRKGSESGENDVSSQGNREVPSWLQYRNNDKWESASWRFVFNQAELRSGDRPKLEKRPAMSNGDQDHSLKVPRTLSKDQTDATESKDSPSMGMERGGIGLISNPLDVNINTEAVAPQLDMGNVSTAPPSSSVPETDEASLESRNAVSIDVGATNKTGPGESS